MRTKSVIVAAATIIYAAAASAQIGSTGLSFPAPAVAVVNASQAALSPGKPGVVTLRDAAQENTEQPKVQSGKAAASKDATHPPEVLNPIAVAAEAAQASNPSTSGVAPPPVAVLPLPSQLNASAFGPRPRPEVTLVRISSKDGIQRATLVVKGLTRAGLTVGDKVLKQVLSEFRDDGVCLDSSLHKPKCATFVPFAYE